MTFTGGSMRTKKAGPPILVFPSFWRWPEKASEALKDKAGGKAHDPQKGTPTQFKGHGDQREKTP